MPAPRARALVGLLAAAAACGCPRGPRITDTGYAGTWARGNERVRSAVGIARDGDSWRVRLQVASADGKYSIRCGWDGRCEEILEGRKIYDHEIRTRLDPGTGHLLVECRGTPAEEGRAPISYLDEYVLAPGGLALDVFTLERDGQSFAGDSRPRRQYTKVSDEAAEPPGSRGAP